MTVHDFVAGAETRARSEGSVGSVWEKPSPRAGVKPGPAADLFLDRLPDDVNLDDPEAVRRACAEITAAVLDGNRQLAEAT